LFRVVVSGARTGPFPYILQHERPIFAAIPELPACREKICPTGNAVFN